MTYFEKNEKCIYCKKNNVEIDSLFTRLCKKCSGQEELILKTIKLTKKHCREEIKDKIIKSDKYSYRIARNIIDDIKELEEND